MSDHFIPIGKYVPPSPQPVEIPGQYQSMNPAMEGSDPSDLSFHEVLNRQMKTSSQTRTIQAPPVEIPQPSHFAGAASNSMSYPAQMDHNPVEVVDIDDPNMPPEVREILLNAPSQTPQDKDWSAEILKNTQDYQQMKSAAGADTGTPPIPDLGASPFSRQTAPQPPQAKITPAYSAFDLSRVTSRTLGAATPINADVMNGTDYNVLSQADVEPLTEPTEMQAGKTSKRLVNKKTSQSEAPEVTPDSEIQTVADPPESEKKSEGVSHAVGSVIQNIASGITLGLYRPKGEAEAQGAARIVYPFKKLVWDTPTSILVGVPKGIAQSVKQSGEENEEGRKISWVGSTYTGSSKPWLSRKRGMRTQEEAPDMEAPPPVMEQVTQRPKWVG